MAGGRLWATMKACFQSRQNVCQQEEQSSRHDSNIFLRGVFFRKLFSLEYFVYFDVYGIANCQLSIINCQLS